jgi:hypothetical protein
MAHSADSETHGQEANPDDGATRPSKSVPWGTALLVSSSANNMLRAVLGMATVCPAPAYKMLSETLGAIEKKPAGLQRSV